MIIQYFKKKENKYKNIADQIYTSALNKSKNLISSNYFNFNNFNSSFEIISIIIIFYLRIHKENNISNFDKINEELIKNLISDLDKTMREFGIGDMSIGKYVKKYVKKFYFRLKAIDKIFLKYSEKNFIEYLNTLKDINMKKTNILASDFLIIYNDIKSNYKLL